MMQNRGCLKVKALQILQMQRVRVPFIAGALVIALDSSCVSYIGNCITDFHDISRNKMQHFQIIYASVYVAMVS